MKENGSYAIRVERYPHSRFWAVWRGDELIVVAVYKKGAQRVAHELIATQGGQP